MAGIKIEIELRRVQGFIFEVPRLKAMLGANALIGHTMRHGLTELVGDRGEKLVWPADLSLEESGNDPMSNTYVDQDGRDDPASLYNKGILVRDGGRFIAMLQTGHAEQFARDAALRLAEALPGVRYDMYVDGVSRTASATAERHSVFLPVLQVCEETGSEVASGLTGPGGDQRWASRSVVHRYQWGERFRSPARPRQTRDAVSLLRERLYPPERNWTEPADLNALAAGSYLALIHADGNRIGQRYANHMKTSASSGISREAHGEAFYHSMRVAVRRALLAATEKAFKGCEGTRPYEVLMLGGDDLLLVCRADRALGFAAEYAGALADPGNQLRDGQCLDVAIGVAIAKSSYPLHRLHDLAEELASSAKRLYRGSAGKCGSVIDWQVVTQAYRGSIADSRRQSDCVRYTADAQQETLLLSRRPYSLAGENGFAGLTDIADKLLASGVADDQGETARSALRALRGACELGYLSGQYAFDQLPATVRKYLGSELWEDISQSDGERTFATRTIDAVDICEISRLGRGTKAP